MVKATSDALWVRSVLQDLGKCFADEIFSDEGAVFGIIRRQELGRMSHLECNVLYLPKLDADKVLAFTNVPGAENPADLGTKLFPGDAVLKHVAFAGGVC